VAQAGGCRRIGRFRAQLPDPVPAALHACIYTVRNELSLTRRGLITGLASFVAAPVILSVSSPMPISALSVTSIDGIEAVAEVLDGEE
jgi:hypothetical protein